MSDHRRGSQWEWMLRGPRRPDDKAGSECHVPMRDLMQEFDAVDSVFDAPLWEAATTWDCTVRQTGALSMPRLRTRPPRPANDNGRSS